MIYPGIFWERIKIRRTVSNVISERKRCKHADSFLIIKLLKLHVEVITYSLFSRIDICHNENYFIYDYQNVLIAVSILI